MPSDQSQAAFQDAVKAVFSEEGASRYKRAKLRDRLANKVLPEWLATALKNGSQQLDGAEFTTFLLDKIVPENNQLTDTSEIKVEGYETFSKAEKQTKLELPLTRTGNGSGAIKCSEMLKNYCEVEKLDGENQYDLYGTKVNATKTLKPQVSNHDSDVVVSIKRFGTQKTGKKIETSYGELIDEVTGVRIGNDVELDIIELENLNGEKQRYEATSFIVHRGNIAGGHYVTYVKEQKPDGNQIWVLYNDSVREELQSVDLPNEAKKAYTIKFSPLSDEEQSVSRYKTKLPESQKDGTCNGGTRCWANAAFAFALSITSLHEASHELSEDATAILAAPDLADLSQLHKDKAQINSDINKIINYHFEGGKFADLLALLKAAPNTDQINDNLATLDLSIETILQSAAQGYLTGLAENQNEEKTKAILDLRDFFGDKSNYENVLKITKEISSSKTAFTENPQDFCANIICPETAASSKPYDEKSSIIKQLGTKKTQLIITTQDLCFQAIMNKDNESLKNLLRDKKLGDNFLTEALCFSVSEGAESATELLMNDFRADPNKKSDIYTKSATEIAKEKGVTLPNTSAVTSSQTLEKYLSEKILIKEDGSEQLSPLEAATKIIPNLKDQNLYLAAKGILSKVLKAVKAESDASTEEFKNKNRVSQIEFSELIGKGENETLQNGEKLTIHFGNRYVRKEFVGDAAKKLKFNDPNFGNNSFANCTFTNCDFTGSSGKQLKFVNCTFGEGCVIPKDLKTLKMNFAGCKFNEKIFAEMENAGELKTKLGIPKDAVGEDGFYQSEKPSASISSGAAFKLNPKMLTRES